MSAVQPDRPRTRRPALKLVKTQELSRDDWLAVRRTGIGGSDAAAAVGLSPYMSPLELWLDKTGRADGLPRPDPDDTASPTYWGTLLEPIVAAVYTKQTGNRVRRINAVLRHPSVPFMLANIDREVVGARDVSILECKTAGEFGARLWRAGVPEYVQIQVQHQLAVTGKTAAHVAVLLCGQALEVFRVQRDDGLIARLVELEARFWRFVESDTPPPADGSESADRALRHLYPGNGGTVDFTDDRRLSSAFTDLVAVRADIEARQAIEAQLKQTIAHAMGDATRAVFETGEVSFKRSKDSSAVDLKRLLGDHPEYETQYAISKPGARRFLISV
ncbi:putative phage-type endonuclease domain protein [Burkholderia pseudomallei MSHR4012]|uniref:YqaJ viral recombinase family nuclease n=1 Tax=Burkholderia pseudomallei TaxID=28450 RepID=UPI0005314DD7|nr:YqaJ viral recombinase family protein [Burkholderia pseudomallei]KGT01060.1 putative phage-type endonuclease domain protein [Burkholderia pseudomallei]KGV12934.1 putative phage-type endonuclease domain protein [Burkholderia pseudomallei MSHR4300]KGV45319.1 putative phage-type endonuclease domain protein [Burkholderia pseudomallei MSHR4012]KGV49607.1 putative phage-type endonuclease domain protein [Burkholderia pseudomallei MSHR4003]OMW53280.1 endonuclease [Burkholderia pseudomallei]